MARKKIIAGNWKMNPLLSKDAEKLWQGIAKNMPRLKNTEIVICPPVLYGDKLKHVSKKIALGAQDAFPGETGAFTGEISTEMLYAFGIRYVILGHSERRALGEGNVDVNKKLKGALTAGLTPVVCVGENARDPNHEYFNFIKTQLEESLSGISKNSLEDLIIAYEPVWAISTTKDRHDATANDSREMAIFIRKVLADKFGKDARGVRILYGGSVNEKTAGEFLASGIDGLLVGKASLDKDKFISIIKICEALSK